jgi:hypothetical protein
MVNIYNVFAQQKKGGFGFYNVFAQQNSEKNFVRNFCSAKKNFCSSKIILNKV